MMRVAPLLLIGALVGVPFAGCTLNPQPLPPGEQPDAAPTNDHGGEKRDASAPAPGDDAGTSAGDDDSGGTVPADATVPDGGSGQFGDAASDASSEAGDAADASDAGASSDAEAGPPDAAAAGDATVD